MALGIDVGAAVGIDAGTAVGLLVGTALNVGDGVTLGAVNFKMCRFVKISSFVAGLNHDCMSIINDSMEYLVIKWHQI